jgi:hypothetical protein
MLGRSIFSHHLWLEDRIYSRAEAWLDLLQIAAIAPQKRMIAGHPIEIPRGGIVASVRFLSVRYKWSNTKVCLFLDSLECEGMIKREKRQGNTVILLCNFDKYNTGKRRKGDGETTPGRRRDDEIEEGKDTKKEKEDRRRPAALSNVQEFCRSESINASDALWFWEKGKGNGWTNGGKAIKDWQATLRSWKTAGYLPSQKNGLPQPSGATDVRRTPLEVRRDAVAKHGDAEFRVWIHATYDHFPSGEDDYRKARESILTAFLHHKGEKA